MLHPSSPHRSLRHALTALALLLLPGLVPAQEICDNGVDDDGNGLVDLNDTNGCPCTLLPPPVNLISNGSFEDHGCCPEGPADYFPCATGWMNYMVSASAEYFNCDFMPAAIPQPVPDGSGVAGFGAFTDWSWQDSHYEFLTTCLSAPMQTGQTYELGFNVAAARLSNFQWPGGIIPHLPLNMGPIDLAIYGYASCPTEPYVFYDPIWGNPMPATYCASDLGWTELGHVTYTPVNAWQEIAFTFTAPFDVQAIMFGPTCPVPQDYISYNSTWPYFFVDDFRLENAEVAVTRTGHPCTNDLVLTAAPYDVPPNAYQWYLDGVAIVGQTGPVLNASALGLGAGMYAMRVIRADGSCALAQKEVTVQYPVPLVTATPQAGCAPLVVQLSNQTDPALSGTLLWDLGDGSTAGSGTVTHTYTQPGSYDVRLTVTSALGCTTDSLFQDLITVHPTPVAAFTTDTTTGCVGTAVHFTNTTSPAGNYTCTWSFGDGQIVQGDCSPTHAYQTPGIYNVLLQVTNAFGCQDDVTQSQLITILPTPAPAFVLAPDSGCVPLNVQFTNHTPGTTDQTALWDLGNGTTSTENDPAATYSTPGSYTISLTMTNALGCSATVTQQDAVTAYGLPVVTFFVEPDSGCAPLPVQFSNTTDPGMIGGCTWDFGDGATSTDCQVPHTYQDAGTYSVSLTVTSPAGCEGDTTLYHLVHVMPSPVADFVHDPMKTDYFHPEITFADRSTSDAIAWAWQLPDALPSSADTSTFSATFPGDGGGAYPVQLIVTNEFGCRDTIVRTVIIDGVFSVFVPNAFTPDNDGVNDLFVPVVSDQVEKDYILRIFDRWGTEIFTSAEPGKGWDGTVKGEAPKTDIYAWRLLARSSVDRIMREYIGHVTLLR
ncbi:MAG: PKD domain-containing protein [Bacteroidetes bacterium]|nr:PKD domain-containing protein [Bacteroidota bacterium]